MSKDLRNISPFRWWAHKVLPLVYDDSLSYYEFLCKVSKKLNEVIENENSLNEAVTELNNFVIPIDVRVHNLINNFASGNYDENHHYEIGDFTTTEDGQFWICTANTTGEFDENCWENTYIEKLYSDAMIEIINAIAMIGAQYDVNGLYNIDDFVVYNGNLYRCHNNNVTGEFDVNKWYSVTVSSVFEEMYKVIFPTICKNIAENYDATRTYNVGDRCIYRYEYFICAETTTGNFDYNKWNVIPLSDEIKELQTKVQEALDEIIEHANKLTDLEVRTYNSLESFTEIYDENESYNVGDFAITLDGCFWRCINPTTGEFNVEDWSTADVTQLYRGIMNTISTNIADDYTPSLTYNVGEYCWFNNILYVALKSVPANTDPTHSAYWERCNVGETIVTTNKNICDSICDEYDATETYNTLDKCMYNNRLYICNDDNITGEFDEQYWSEINVSDVLDAMNNEIDNNGQRITQNANDITQNANDIRDIKNTVEGAIIKKYNTTTQYSAGDMCLNGNSIAIANKSTTGTFDVGDWSGGYPIGNLITYLLYNSVADRITENTTYHKGDFGIVFMQLVRFNVDYTTPSDLSDIDSTKYDEVKITDIFKMVLGLYNETRYEYGKDSVNEVI